MQNYIWDFDGMLFNSYPHITAAFLKMLNDHGIKADFDEARALLEVTYASAYEHYGVTDEMKKEFQNYEHDYELLPVALPFENSYKTIEALFAQGKKHFIYTHRGKESSQHYLQSYGFSKFFSGYVDSSNGFSSKPAPDAINYICETYNLDKSETVMIGDREIDVLSGKNAGVYGCLFTRKDNVQSSADYIIKDIIEVLDIK